MLGGPSEVEALLGDATAKIVASRCVKLIARREFTTWTISPTRCCTFYILTMPSRAST